MSRSLTMILVFLICASCNKGLLHSEYVAIDNGVWKKEKIVSLQFENLDTLNRHHMYLNVRNDNRYEFSNLFLILQMEAPSGNTEVDTLEYEMALSTGEWMGKGMGSVKESKLWYKENIEFGESGVYKLEIQHAMRKNGSVEGLEDLVGITDVGIQIEKAK